jgi:peptide/nickel transport system substrate-binding protein
VKRWIAASAVLAVLAAGGCGQERPRPGAGAKPSASEPQPGGTLYRRLESDIVTLNPVLATSRYDRLVTDYIFTPLVHLDENLTPIPGLARQWEITPDGRQYTFELNEKATFSDGKPVRASDVIFTLRRIVDPQSEAATVAAGFELVDLSRSRPIDDHTVVIGFREAMASQLVQFNNLLVLPEHVYGKGDFRHDYNDVAVGSGPYVLARRQTGKEIVVNRRKEYWGKHPYIDTVVFKVIVNTATAWSAVRRGDVDETPMQSDVWVREHTNPTLLRTLEFPRFYMLAYNYIGWNGRNPLFADKRVRRALSMCVDVKSIINNLFGGTARAMTGPFVPDQWSYNPDVTAIEYDPEGAKKIFTSLGWLDTNGDGVLDKGGRPFEFDLIITGGASATAIAQMLQASLKSIGVEMGILVVDPAVAIQRTIFSTNYEAAYLSWELDPDPDPYALFHSSQFPPRGQNFVFCSNPDADRLIEQARKELDQSKRSDLYRQLHAVLADDQPYTWINQPSLKWAINRRVKGVRASKGWGLFGWYPGPFDWWIEQPARPAS